MGAEETRISCYVFGLQREHGNNIVCRREDAPHSGRPLTFLESCVEYMRYLRKRGIQYITVEDAKGRNRYMPLFIMMMRRHYEEMRDIDIIEDGEVLRIRLF